MHLSPSLDYPWTLRLTDEELTLIQQVLRGDELSIEEEDAADHLGSTLDLIRPKAERTRNNRRNRRKNRQQSTDDEDFDVLEDDED